MSLYVLFGIPASGKTTVAGQMASEHGFSVHSYDEVRDMKTWIDGMLSDLSAGLDVVCDCKCVRADVRKWLLQKVADIPCRKVLVAVVTPVDECIRRNEQREGTARLPDHHIEIAAKYMQPPTESEGWDEIIVYTN